MEKNSNDLQDILARMDRLETGLGVQIDRFIKSEQMLAKAGKELMLEVEQFKAAKHSLAHALPEMIKSSLERQAELMIPKLISPLSEEFKKATENSIDDSLEKAQKLENGIEYAISKADRFIHSQRRELTLRGIMLSIIFCFSSILTAGAIFYYFPQSVTYGVTSSMSKSMALGETLIENFNKLSPQQKDFFMKKAADKLKRFS